jgi:hypothetical protein
MAAPVDEGAMRGKAAQGRKPRGRARNAPYAGMTRIRFEGFSRLRVLSA